MKKIFLLVLSLALGVCGAQKNFAHTTNYLWATAGNWTPSGEPGIGDSVIIPNDSVIVGAATAAIGALTVLTGGRIHSNGSILTITPTSVDPISIAGIPFSGSGIFIILNTQQGAACNISALPLPKTWSAYFRTTALYAHMTLTGNLTCGFFEHCGYTNNATLYFDFNGYDVTCSDTTIYSYYAAYTGGKSFIDTIHFGHGTITLDGFGVHPIYPCYGRLYLDTALIRITNNSNSYGEWVNNATYTIMSAGRAILRFIGGKISTKTATLTSANQPFWEVQDSLPAGFSIALADSLKAQRLKIFQGGWKSGAFAIHLIDSLSIAGPDSVTFAAVTFDSSNAVVKQTNTGVLSVGNATLNFKNGGSLLFDSNSTWSRILSKKKLVFPAGKTTTVSNYTAANWDGTAGSLDSILSTSQGNKTTISTPIISLSYGLVRDVYVKGGPIYLDSTGTLGSNDSNVTKTPLKRTIGDNLDGHNYAYNKRNAFSQFSYITTDRVVRIGGVEEDYPSYNCPIAIFKNGVYLTSFSYTNVEGIDSSALTGLGPDTITVVNGYSRRQSGVNFGCYATAVYRGDYTPIPYSQPVDRFVVVGNSIANGYVTTNPQLNAWPMLLRAHKSPTRVSEYAFGAYSLNLEGSTASARTILVNRIDSLFDGSGTNTLWLALGVNDYIISAWNAAAFQTAYNDLLLKFIAKRPTLRIYCQSPLPAPCCSTDANAQGSKLADYRTAIQNATSGLNVTFVNGLTRIKATLSGDALHPGDVGQAEYDSSVEAIVSTIVVDSLHPSHGSPAGGGVDSIHGINLTGSSVRWNGSLITPLSNTDALVRVTIPVGTPGTVLVIDSTAQGKDTASYIYDTIPHPVSVSPATCNFRYGLAHDSITVTGGMVIDSVKYKTSKLTITGQTATRIIVTVPAVGAVDSATIFIWGHYGYLDSLHLAFRYLNQDTVPVFSSATPMVSKLAGGAVLKMRVTHAALIDSLNIDGTLVTPDSAQVDTLWALVPAHAAGTVSIQSIARHGYRDTVSGFVYAAIYGAAISGRAKCGDTGSIVASWGLTGITHVHVGDSSSNVLAGASDTQVRFLWPCYSSGKQDVTATATAGAVTFTGGANYSSGRRGSVFGLFGGWLGF